MNSYRFGFIGLLIFFALGFASFSEAQTVNGMITQAGCQGTLQCYFGSSPAPTWQTSSGPVPCQFGLIYVMLNNDPNGGYKALYATGLSAQIMGSQVAITYTGVPVQGGGYQCLVSTLTKNN